MLKGRFLAGILTACMLIAMPISAIDSAFVPVFKPTLQITKATGEIKIDGKLNDNGWAGAARSDYFHERYPGDMTKPPVNTEVMVTYDEDNLFVAFNCYDDPTTIRATMSQRDRFGSDDHVCLMIDTYGDAAWAYELEVNPYGIQRDMLWSSVFFQDDIGFDLIWESAAQITSTGYQVEMAVPFASMRFPNKELQEWRVDFMRERPRETNNRYCWAARDRNERCSVCQWGTLKGMTGVRPGKGFELMPTYVASQSGTLADGNDPDSKFDNSDFDGEISLGAKYAVSSDISIEGAYNPDFSQIEADADQIDVNTTIALYYPERRPFFQEGSDIFITLFNSFYTRTINDPEFAIKAIGRLSKTRFAVVSAQDENSPYMIPLDEGSILLNTDKSNINVLRGIYSVGASSHLGLLFTDRRFEDNGSGTIAALDYNIGLTRNYSIDGQYILSHTREPDAPKLTEDYGDLKFDYGNHTAALDGETYYGTAFISRLLRSGRHWNFTLDYNQTSPTYRTQTGYDPWNDYRIVTFFSNLTFYPEGRFLQEYSPRIYAFKRWFFDGRMKWEGVNLAANFELAKAQTHIDIMYHLANEVWYGTRFYNLRSINFELGGRFCDQIGYEIHYGYGSRVYLNDLIEGRETTVQGYLNLKPIDRLIIQPTIIYSLNRNPDTDERFYEGYISRTRFELQANRQLSFRLVLQYNDFHERWDIDPLMTYRLSPFSVFYFGSTYDYDNFDLPDENRRWKLSSRQLFMKLQYLFRV